jgi:hypothetical protein
VPSFFDRAKKGAPVVGASGNRELSNGLSKADKTEQKAGFARGAASQKKLRAEVSLLESALKKLVKGRQPGRTEDYSAAFLLRDKAQRMIDIMPGPDSKAAKKVLGSPYEPELKRLRHVVNEAQIIYDEYKVEMTKKKAGNIYMQAGRDAAIASVPGKPGSPAKGMGLTKLTAPAKKLGFDDLQDDVKSGSASELASAVRGAGKTLGLAPAEIAAIITFTAEDYKYINPATANSPSWMKEQNPAVIDLLDKPGLTASETKRLNNALQTKGQKERQDERKAELTARRDEGALHAGMAMQGLSKLPKWKGLTYRGEVLDMAVFDSRYTTASGPAPVNDQGDLVPGTKLKPVQKTLGRTAISSTSKKLSRAIHFLDTSLKKPPIARLIYETQITNGRDISAISANPAEEEVATLPGAAVTILSAVTGSDYVLVKCKQTK